MIVLDTNVVSELLKPLPDPAVREWLNRQAPETLYLASVSLSELLLGMELLSDGRRKRDLAGGLRQLLDGLFGERIFPFGAESARVYAALIAHARRRGLAIEVPDGQIAATAKEHGFAVATRDRGPFEAAGVRVINPWAA